MGFLFLILTEIGKHRKLQSRTPRESVFLERSLRTSLHSKTLHFTFSHSVQSLSRVGLCDPMDCSTPGFPVFHYLPEFVQIHVHGVGDVIQPPHPLSSPSPSFSLSQHQGLSQ